MSDEVREAIRRFREGEIVIVTDDDDRENEGDLVCAASLCTPEKMAFIIRHTCGIVCTPLTEARARALNLAPMVATNDAPLGTAFTVSVDVVHGLTTGISAEQRTNTARALANANMGAQDFVRPGHVFPLVARDGGVLMRSGHTEAAVDLCALAGLPEVGVICELANDDGTVMKGPADRRLRPRARTCAHLGRRPDRLAAGARAPRRARRRVHRGEPDRRAPGHRLRDALRQRAALRLRPRRHRRRARRPGAAAPVGHRRRHPRRGRQPARRLERIREAGAGVVVYLRDGAAGVPLKQEEGTEQARPEALARRGARRPDPARPRRHPHPDRSRPASSTTSACAASGSRSKRTSRWDDPRQAAPSPTRSSAPRGGRQVRDPSSPGAAPRPDTAPEAPGRIDRGCPARDRP